ncbi:MAG: SdrD B-like domain-containing protein [Tepidisphaeraceae bacterium]
MSASSRRSLVDSLEARRLLAAVDFVLNGDLSYLEASGSITTTMASGALLPQATGSARATYAGTIKTDLTTTAIKFVGGSTIDAKAKPGPYQPGGSGADYAFRTPISSAVEGAVLSAIREFVLDATSTAALTIGTGGAISPAGVSTPVKSGRLDFGTNVPTVAPWGASIPLAGAPTSQANSAVSLVISGGVATLTLGLNFTVVRERPPVASPGADTTGPARVELKFVGKLVATAKVAEPPKYGVIAGLKFNDLNGNGVRDVVTAGAAYEPGLAGVTIYLDSDNDGVLDDGERRTVTASNGSYRFGELLPGAYNVREVVPAGWKRTAPASGKYEVTITAGQIVEGKLFGNQKIDPATGSIRGVKFEDWNGTGLRDAGEPGLAGWTIYDDANNNKLLDAGEKSVVTNAEGGYVLTGLKAGQHLVREVNREGYRQTAPTGGLYIVNLEPGQVVDGKVFGNRGTGVITGIKFNDVNGNGKRDAAPTSTTTALVEPGMAGVTIFLDTDNDGILDTNERRVVTNAEGRYAFEGVAPGSYNVREVVQTGWKQTTPSTGKYEVVMTPGEWIGGKDFGNRRIEAPKYGAIAGIKFNDLNGNGIRDAAPGTTTLEPVLAGWRIFLDTDNDGVWDDGERSVLTNADGAYRFGDLLPGTYNVREVQQGGWKQTAPASGKYEVVVVAGVTVEGKDFGNKRLETTVPGGAA